MKRTYDFSRAAKGRFFHKEAETNLPVIKENQVLAEVGDRQMATFDRKTTKTHAQIWSTMKYPRR